MPGRFDAISLEFGEVGYFPDGARLASQGKIEHLVEVAAAVRLLTNVYLREYENRMLRDAKECQGCEGLWDLTKPDIRQRQSARAAREFVSRGNFTMVADSENADAELTGTITQFTVTPIGLAEEEATNFLVQIRAQVNFRDLVQNRVLYSNNSFLFRQQFEIEVDPRAFFDVSNVAVDLIAAEFARTVVSSILEGF